MSFTESFVDVVGGKVQLLKGGSGSPIFVLHHDVGNPGWLPYYMELAENHTVYVPSHPGFGKSERPEWARNVRDIACIYQRLLKDLGLNSTAAVGLGFGGWILAEMPRCAITNSATWCWSTRWESSPPAARSWTSS